MAIIEKDKPLPRHTRLDYDECYAKLVLEKFFPEEYQNLTISDRPDLRDEQHNIELKSHRPSHSKSKKLLCWLVKFPICRKKTRKGGLNI